MTNFQNADLQGGDYQASRAVEADFDGANLFGSQWAFTDFSGVIFRNVNLHYTGLSDTKLKDSILTGPGGGIDRADLTTTQLVGMHMERGIFRGDVTGGQMNEATFDGVTANDSLFVNAYMAAFHGLFSNFRSDDFSGASLAAAVFDGCNLTDASFLGANMQEGIFRDSKFVEANLSNADLRGSVLNGSDFTDAELQNARMEGAIASGTIFTGAHWSNTTCPDGSNSDSNPNCGF